MFIRPFSKDEDGPFFKVVTDRGLVTSLGTKVFFKGVEIPFLVAIKHETDFGNRDDVPHTTITLKLAGSQVEVEYREDDDAPPAL